MSPMMRSVKKLFESEDDLSCVATKMTPNIDITNATSLATVKVSTPSIDPSASVKNPLSDEIIVLEESVIIIHHD